MRLRASFVPALLGTSLYLISLWTAQVPSEGFIGLYPHLVIAGLAGGFLGWALVDRVILPNGEELETDKLWVRLILGVIAGNYLSGWASSLLPIAIPEGTGDAAIAVLVAALVLLIPSLIQARLGRTK